MSEMVERVRNVIHAAYRRTGCGDGDAICKTPINCTCADAAARAAILAMRAPTEAMSEVGGMCRPFLHPMATFTPGQIIANSAYRAMIDEALK